VLFRSPQLSDSYGLAVLVVVHQHRSTRAELADLLAHHTRLPVHTAFDKEPIVSGHVYVCPANYHMLVEPDRTMSLSTDPRVQFARPSIDVLFESAARVYGERLVGVLLSGASADGASGLAIIRARGGLIFCQDPSTAVVPIMPDAGVSAAGPDAIESPTAIGIKLARLHP